VPAILWTAGSIALLAATLLIVYHASNRETRCLTPDLRGQLGGAYITLERGVTHYELSGPAGGRLVLLIHGLTVPLWTWDPHMDALHGAGLRTLRYDMFGRGFSDRPRVRYDRALFVEQIRQLLDSLGIAEPVAVVGSSLGSGIGVTFAALHPERVSCLVCLSPLVNSGRVPTRMFRPPVVGEFLMRMVGMPFYTRRALHFYRNHPERERYVARYLEQISLKGFEYSGLSEIRSDIGGDYRDAYRVFGATGKPSMLLYGAGDTEFTAASVAEARDLLVNCESHTIEGAGHGVELHLHPAVNGLLTAFLRDRGAIQKCFQFAHRCCGKPRFLEAEKVFAYEHGSKSRVGDQTQEALIHEIDEDEFYPNPIPGRIVLDELEAWLRANRVSSEPRCSASALKQQLAHTCLNVEQVVYDLYAFAYI